jgi:ribose 5-phosphate isomerase A
MNLKQQAAEAAISFVQSGMVVGLGTGSTADYFLLALAHALRDQRLRDIRGVPTSQASERRANELGIPVASLSNCPTPDVVVDGADEVDPHLNLIKGRGGALLREKLVAQNSRKPIIIVDASKVVQTLGTTGPLPVEVVPFEHTIHERFFRDLGATPQLRRNPDGSPFVTDNGNYIYHCTFDRIDDPRALEAKLHNRAGVLETGLFLDLAQVVLIATPLGVEQRLRHP